VARGFAAAYAALLAGFLLASRAVAEDAQSCPDRASVREALSALASDEQSRAALAEVERAELELEDLGDRYRVTVNGRAREYSDPNRDCKARAQVAAVFTALVLNPSSDQTAEEPAPAPPPPVATPAPVATPLVSEQTRRPLDVRVGAALSFAPVKDTPRAAGLLVRVAYSWHAWGLELGGVLPASSAELAVGAARAAVLRYPIDFGARFSCAAGPLEADVEGGAILSVLRLRDLSEGAREPVTRLEPGARLGAGLRLRRLAVSPAAGVYSAFIPVRYPLALEPSGVLAHTPAVWFGAWVGLSAAFD
jgi:hypothetical protein